VSGNFSIVFDEFSIVFDQNTIGFYENITVLRKGLNVLFQNELIKSKIRNLIGEKLVSIFFHSSFYDYDPLGVTIKG
jgi:hypothetical protein